MLNFTWWVNRKDAEGRNVFQGGFLGLDNIGVFDRSASCRPAPHRSSRRNQLDAMYALNLMRIALEWLKKIRSTKTSHQVLRALLAHRGGMNNFGEAGIGLWTRRMSSSTTFCIYPTAA